MNCLFLSSRLAVTRSLLGSEKQVYFLKNSIVLEDLAKSMDLINSEDIIRDLG